MKVLIVCSGNNGSISPFVKEQVEELRKLNVIIEYYLIEGKGIWGYVRNLPWLKNKIKAGGYQLVSAHYGLSGLLACLQRIVPVVITLHGSDVNTPFVRPFSYLAHKLAKQSIFVSKYMAFELGVKQANVIPCGVDFSVFYPMIQEAAKKAMNLSPEKKYILFSSSFDRKVKNYTLAKKALNTMQDLDVELIEMKNYSRKEIAYLMNSVELALLTSYSEGSPQFIKEAMACNCPIVSTNVGDVRDIIEDTDGCYLTSYNIFDVAEKIKSALAFKGRTTGRKNVESYRSDLIAEEVLTVYKLAIDNT